MSRPMFTKADYLNDVVFDLDDFAMSPENSAPCLYHLRAQKKMFPNLKVTLFAIPFYEGVDNSSYFKSILRAYDWIEIAIHGWTHATSVECKEWSRDEAKKRISDAYKMGCFVKGFKAPGWQISRETYQALDELQFWVADHSTSAYTEPGVPNEQRRPATLKAYTVDHPWIVHGHTWDLTNEDPNYRNGIRQIIDEHGVPWDKNTKFHFISEVMK